MTVCQECVILDNLQNTYLKRRAIFVLYVLTNTDEQQILSGFLFWEDYF